MTSVLSSPIGSMRSGYDVVIVGSGYGGGIAASRLSRAGKTVCVLERGAEKQPGDYPDNAVSLLEEIQLDTPAGRLGSDTALFDMRYNDSVNVVVGCGLGGTSLINAGICLRPDPAVFANANWPAALRAETALAAYFDRAEAMLKPSPNPATFLASAKTQALQAGAAAVGKTAAPVSILVNFQPLPGDKNHVGVTQLPCIGCGDCVSGCNHRAKSTVIMNYLPDAKNHGAEIFTRARARTVEPAGSGWIVHGQIAGADSDSSAFQVKGGVVILAAGTLGSTELLLRSRDKGLAISPQIGSRFSANGDMIGFAYNTGRDINGIGLGSRKPGDQPPIGPCSTVMVDWRDGTSPANGAVMEDGAIPGAVSAFLAPALATASGFLGTEASQSLWNELKQKARAASSELAGPYTGAIANTLFLLCMAYDDSRGRMFLRDDRLRVDWPGLGQQPQFATASDKIRGIAEALGGTYVQDPVWSKLTGHSMISGHPLGGCPMADDAGRGVVNHKGQVFRGTAAGADVHAGLYVMDGSIVPTALGVNPLFTISALAERSCEELARDYGWTIAY
jgi:cholesterol oxidase